MRTSNRRSVATACGRSARADCDRSHFNDTDKLAERILGFQAQFAQTRHTPDWNFTPSNQHALLDRLDQRGWLIPAACTSFRQPVLAERPVTMTSRCGSVRVLMRAARSNQKG